VVVSLGGRTVGAVNVGNGRMKDHSPRWRERSVEGEVVHRM